MGTENGILTPEELAAWRGLLRVHSAVLRELDAELEQRHRLPVSSYDVLGSLAEAPDGRLRMRELAEVVLLSRSGLSRLVDRLEQQGLVERQSCPSDARGCFAVLTEEGRKALAAARPTHLEGVRRRFLSRLEPEELRELASLWERIEPGAARVGP